MAVLLQNVVDALEKMEVTSGDFTPIPDGEYLVKVTKTGDKPTSVGGRMAIIELTVLGPKFQGRKLWESFNIEHPDTEKLMKGLQYLKRMHLAFGLEHMTDTDQLVGRTCLAQIYSRDEGQYGVRNHVKKYMKNDADNIPASAVPDPAATSFSDAFSGASPFEFK